jgi:hypothetical protein
MIVDVDITSIISKKNYMDKYVDSGNHMIYFKSYEIYDFDKVFDFYSLYSTYGGGESNIKIVLHHISTCCNCDASDFSMEIGENIINFICYGDCNCQKHNYTYKCNCNDIMKNDEIMTYKKDTIYIKSYDKAIIKQTIKLIAEVRTFICGYTSVKLLKNIIKFAKISKLYQEVDVEYQLLLNKICVILMDIGKHKGYLLYKEYDNNKKLLKINELREYIPEKDDSAGSGSLLTSIHKLPEKDDSAGSGSLLTSIHKMIDDRNL